MNHLRNLLIISLAVAAFPVAAQQGQEPGPAPEPPMQVPKDLPDNWKYDYRGDFWPDNARRKDEQHSKRSPPEITPDGWFDDYDYQSNLDEYLQAKYRQSLDAGKETYIYLYADWYGPCRDFRKSIRGEDYTQLFASNEIVMLDYAFFNSQFGTQIKNLPLFIKINSGGKLGPESLNPLAFSGGHPRRAYAKLEEFFQSSKKTY